MLSEIEIYLIQNYWGVEFLRVKILDVPMIRYMSSSYAQKTDSVLAICDVYQGLLSLCIGQRQNYETIEREVRDITSEH